MAELSKPRSSIFTTRLASTTPGLGTVLTEAVWIAIAVFALFARQEGLAHHDPIQNDFLTLVSVLACAGAFAVVFKNSFINPRWIWLMNVIAVLLAVAFFLQMILLPESTLGPVIAPL